MTLIKINDFYPIFISEQNEKGEWVSQGFYSNQLANEEQTPPEILKAVFAYTNGQIKINSLQPTFEIPDTYPPEPDEITLIARDIGKYCILAVANFQKDNKAREFVGYRYFWLKKQDLHLTDADGIATLVSFWEKNKRLSLDLNPHHQTTSYQGYSPIYTTQKYLEDYSKSLQLLLNQVTISPSLFEANKDNKELTPTELHCLAVYISKQRQKKFKGWAWNIKRLEQFEDLNAIYCANTEALSYFRSKTISENQLIAHSTSQISQNLPELPSILEHDKDNISKILLAVSQNPKNVSKVAQLLDYFHKYGSKLYEAKDRKIKIIFTTDENPSTKNIKYNALLVIIGMDLAKDEAERDSEITSIKISLLNLKKDQKKIAIEFIMILLASLRANNQDNSALQLISQAELLERDIQNKLPNNKLLAATEIILGNHLRNKPSSSKKDKNKLSQRSKSAHNEMENNQSAEPKLGDLVLLFIATLFILGGIAIFGLSSISFVSQNEMLPSAEESVTNPDFAEDNILSLLKVLQALYVGMDLFDEQTEILKIDSTDLDKVISYFGKNDNTNYQEFIFPSSSLEPKINQIVEENKTAIKNYLQNQQENLNITISSNFAEQIQSIRESEIYSYIQVSYLPDLIVDNLPDLPKSETTDEAQNIKVLQEVLKKNNWYQGEVTGKFDESTKLAVKEVQKHYKVQSPNDVVTQVTWQLLLEKIRDYQVEKTLDFIVKSLESDKSFTDILAEINECKTIEQTLHFTICLEKK